MKYQVIIADLPLFYNPRNAGGEVKNKTQFGGGAEKHYDLMKDKDILDLKPYINGVMDNNCILFLWATCPKLDFCIEVMKHWGFTYKTIPFVWVKITKDRNLIYNPGFYTSSNVEFLLLGVKQKKSNFFKPVIKMQQQVIMHERLRHSEKPNIFQEKINLMYPLYNKLELFARRKIINYTCLGNEITGNDIKIDLEELAKIS